MRPCKTIGCSSVSNGRQPCKSQSEVAARAPDVGCRLRHRGPGGRSGCGRLCRDSRQRDSETVRVLFDAGDKPTEDQLRLAIDNDLIEIADLLKARGATCNCSNAPRSFKT